MLSTNQEIPICEPLQCNHKPATTNRLYYGLHMQIIFLQSDFFSVDCLLIPEVFNFRQMQTTTIFFIE